MKWVDRVETYDGVIHENCEKATRHLQKQYDDRIVNLARSLVQTDGKYKHAAEWIDKHLDELVKLKQIKDDMVFPPEDREE